MVKTSASLIGSLFMLAAMPVADAAPRNTDVLTSTVQSRIDAENSLLESDRQALQAHFKEAYTLYPGIPEGILEAMAFVGSRWQHLTPAHGISGHHAMPQAYGVMGLYNGQSGFGDSVALAAAALGVSPDAVKEDERLNVLAVAALLNRSLLDVGLQSAEPEALVPFLRMISGLPEGGEILSFARNSYAYDVLLALDKGVDDLGITVPSSPIEWNAAFEDGALVLLNAPKVRLIVDQDRVETASLTPMTQADIIVPQGLRAGNPEATTSSDYPPALWVASPNYSGRNGASITKVAIHTTQGSYSGAISWFQNPDSNVSAHYVIRSSDGQVTQMVLEEKKAWHIGSENGYTIGIEHEGYVDTSSYYTTAMYGSSGDLSKDICGDNPIDCNATYDGPSSSGTDQLNGYTIQGHQHFPNQNHTDPGVYWDWPRYADLTAGGDGGGPTGPTLPGGGGGGRGKKVIDDFEVSEGHFDTQPTYSGSTVGVSSASTADRSNAQAQGGSYSEKITLVDDASSASPWSVRLLSGSGSPSNNYEMSSGGGRIILWVYADTAGLKVAPLMDDSDGIEAGTLKSVPTGKWTKVSWKLADGNQWDGWADGNGSLSAGTVTLDGLLIERSSGTSTATLYIDDVTHSRR